MTRLYLTALATLLAGCQPQPPVPTPAARQRATVAATQPTQAVRAAMAVSTVHDGDTLTGYVSFSDAILGCEGTVLRHVRILGINAPELSKPGGIEARDYLTSLLKGKAVTIAPDKDDAFGRLLAGVYADGEDVGAAMIASGHAVPFKP